MAKYQNKQTGIIVEPSCDVSALAFLMPPWEEHHEPIPELDGEEMINIGGEDECLKSEQTPISTENMQTNTSPVDTEVITPTEKDGEKSATRTKKSS